MGPDAAHPGVAARLNLLQGFVVVNGLGTLGQVDDDLGISVGQEPVEVVGRSQAIEIDEILDELLQRKNRSARLKYHGWDNRFEGIG